MVALHGDIAARCRNFTGFLRGGRRQGSPRSDNPMIAIARRGGEYTIGSKHVLFFKKEVPCCRPLIGGQWPDVYMASYPTSPA
jgi:hypothetical protein